VEPEPAVVVAGLAIGKLHFSIGVVMAAGKGALYLIRSLVRKPGCRTAGRRGAGGRACWAAGLRAAREGPGGEDDVISR
jgi:hypothetical protein